MDVKVAGCQNSLADLPRCQAKTTGPASLLIDPPLGTTTTTSIHTKLFHRLRAILGYYLLGKDQFGSSPKYRVYVVLVFSSSGLESSRKEAKGRTDLIRIVTPSPSSILIDPEEDSKKKIAIPMKSENG
ncbi:hypothetical protein DAPPUDRAFT_236811 [Daphnia pulex]|uniref:Uncharacterized protein n=1 Tax=Daphnia pulex TaxID=6669 RepID=E9G200_DAPPU|nr:hypothetical protein DAPPUDRAFT_236811 [Daphnia pulex]|eukprot:EFX86159.1 hypothetical protein DAPPUDRAFT_236811 [Daphnia pulex]